MYFPKDRGGADKTPMPCRCTDGKTQTVRGQQMNWRMAMNVNDSSTRLACSSSDRCLIDQNRRSSSRRGMLNEW